MDQLENLVRLLTRSLVDEPDAVEVTGREDGSRVEIEVRVADGDMGRIIGKQGRTVKAIRTVTKASSVRLGKRVSVEVVDR